MRPQIEARGTQLAFVHIGREERAQQFFDGYGLGDCPRLQDLGSKYYAMFGLQLGNLLTMLGPKTFLGGIRAVRAGNKMGGAEGNTLQMPGVFLIHKGAIVRSFIHKSPADVVDTMSFIEVPS